MTYRLSPEYLYTRLRLAEESIDQVDTEILAYAEDILRNSPLSRGVSVQIYDLMQGCRARRTSGDAKWAPLGAACVKIRAQLEDWGPTLGSPHPTCSG